MPRAELLRHRVGGVVVQQDVRNLFNAPRHCMVERTRTAWRGMVVAAKVGRKEQAA